jgi:hypothetical protein
MKGVSVEPQPWSMVLAGLCASGHRARIGDHPVVEAVRVASPRALP